jgi:hypothetical protein
MSLYRVYPVTCAGMFAALVVVLYVYEDMYIQCCHDNFSVQPGTVHSKDLFVTADGGWGSGASPRIYFKKWKPFGAFWSHLGIHSSVFKLNNCPRQNTNIYQKCSECELCNSGK